MGKMVWNKIVLLFYVKIHSGSAFGTLLLKINVMFTEPPKYSKYCLTDRQTSLDCKRDFLTRGNIGEQRDKGNASLPPLGKKINQSGRKLAMFTPRAKVDNKG